ncbi:MAG: quinol dehydrogenase ferredoxin subunit NapH [Melioribacteraceae bacterium]|nr:quinol dehydrogenase ferredoxin subunit NapH [Melioribacteraceae bacterium]
MRRVSQLSILFLFFGGNYFGWKVLIGNYSSAILLDEIFLSDPFATLQILVSGFVGAANLFIGAAIVLLFYAIIGGRVFCSWVCPVNMLSDFSLWLREKMRIKDKSKIILSKNVRYYILALSFILSAIIGIAAFEIISPISIFHRAIIFGVGGSWSVILALFFFELTIVKNGWCGYICPLGAFYSIVGKYGLLKVYHEKEKCTLCNKCFDVCPEDQVLSIIGKKDGYIKSGECTNCAQCIDVCDDDALKFSINYFKNNLNNR